MRLTPSASSVAMRSVKRSLTRRLWHDDNLPADVVEALWNDDIDRLLYASSPLQVKDRCIVARYDHPAGPLLVKRHSWGGLSRTLRSVGREASAHRTVRLGLHLHSLGIPTPLPRACIEYRIGPWGYRSYLLTDYDEGTSLYRYIRFGSQSDDELRHVARQVARIWQEMIETGISHNDLKPENFIVDLNRNVCLIDLEKARVYGKPDQQRQRNIFDVNNFLHIRGWHQRLAAREIFLNELRNTAFGQWVDGAFCASEADVGLSVLLVCHDLYDVLSTRQAIDSVRDIADEVVIIGVADDGSNEVRDRIHLCGAKPATLKIPALAEHPWVLVLHQNEVVTPVLAKELQQRITDPKANDAYRIPLETQFFGHSVAAMDDDESQSVRLFQQNRCSYSLVGGEATISADPVQTGRLSGTIQKCICGTVDEFVQQLNERTTINAWQRHARGERARLFRRIPRSIGRFFKLYARRGGIGSNWTGFQIAALEAAFTWLEEAKLRHLSTEFCLDRQSVDDSGSASTPHFESRWSTPQWDVAPQKNAA